MRAKVVEVTEETIVAVFASIKHADEMTFLRTTGVNILDDRSNIVPITKEVRDALRRNELLVNFIGIHWGDLNLAEMEQVNAVLPKEKRK